MYQFHRKFEMIFDRNLNFFIKSKLLTHESAKNAGELPQIKVVFQQPIHIQIAKPGVSVSSQERVIANF